MIPVATDLNGIATINTDALPLSQRFAFWSDVVCEHFSPSYNDIPAGADRTRFSARMGRRSLGTLGISHIQSTPQVSVRNRDSLRRNPTDCFFLSYVTEGAGLMRQGGRETVQKAGDFLLYDSAQPFEYRWDGPYSGYWIRLPRKLLTTRIANADVMTARPISTAAPVGRLVGSLIEEAYGLDLCGDDPAARRVASSLIDLVAAAFETHAAIDYGKSARHQGLLDRAQSYVLANLEDTTLDCDRLMDELGVSRRTLTRVFAQADTTPIKWIWAQRLERSREMILSGGAQRVTDVAMACGFSDVSHFSRAFKAQFGMTAKAMMTERAR